MSEGSPAVTLLSERHAVIVAGREVALTSTQFRLLKVLVTHPWRIFSRRELLPLAMNTWATERTVDAHVKDLRRKLERHGDLISTVRGRGYCWCPAPAK
jgi:DNA-binding response OmpR family regulator